MEPEGLPLAGPFGIETNHQAESFDCSNEDLNSFLKRHALQNHRSNMAKTYVALCGNRVVGFYSLCAASAEYADVPERFQKGVPRHAMPFTLLARLGVDRKEQGIGLGSALIKDALKRFLRACDIVASRGLVTHAKDDSALAFYRKYGFEAWPLDSRDLYLMHKDIRKTVQERASSSI